jgi:hypothetical protein
MVFRATSEPAGALGSRQDAMNSDRPDELDLRSHDIAEATRQELLRLFPEIRTEGGRRWERKLECAEWFTARWRVA